MIKVKLNFYDPNHWWWNFTNFVEFDLDRAAIKKNQFFSYTSEKHRDDLLQSYNAKYVKQCYNHNPKQYEHYLVFETEKDYAWFLLRWS